jgi:hypothetical protein
MDGELDRGPSTVLPVSESTTPIKAYAAFNVNSFG